MVDRALFFLRYAGVGIVATVTHIVTLTLLSRYLGASLPFSTLVGFLLATSIGFYLNSKLSFRVRKITGQAFGKYFVVVAGGALANYFLSALVLRIGFFSPLLGVILVAFFVSTLVFVALRFWVFRPIHRQDASTS
jgi:putative flippase GtrA